MVPRRRGSGGGTPRGVAVLVCQEEGVAVVQPSEEEGVMMEPQRRG